MSLHTNTSQILSGWKPSEPAQEALRQAFLGYLAAREDACARACTPGHITAAVVIFNPERTHTLLTLHRRLGAWLQLGGHCEETDHTLADTAVREVREESGISNASIEAQPFHLDVHPVTCSLGIPTRHFDIRFRAFVPMEAQLTSNHESVDLRWWRVDELPENAMPDIPALITTAINSISSTEKYPA